MYRCCSYTVAMHATTREGLKTGLVYTFYLYFATFPFLTFSSFLYAGTAARSVILLALAGVLGMLLAGYLILDSGRALVVRLSPAWAALTLYLGALVLSGLAGLSFSTTFWSLATRTSGVWYFVSLGLVMLLLQGVVRERAVRDRLILVTVLSAAFYSVLYFLGPDGLDLMFRDVTTDALTFGNSSFAAMYLFGALMLSIYYVVRAEVRTWWMYLVPVVLMLQPAFTSVGVWRGDFSHGLIGEAQASSYTAWLSLVVLAAVYGIARIKQPLQRARVAYGALGLGVVVALFSWYSLFSPHGYLRAAYLSQSSAARPLVWQLSERAIAERPMLGWGADNFERVYERFYDNRLLQKEYGAEGWFDRAHNVIIDQLLDNGVVGLVAYGLVYVVLLLMLTYVALNARERSDRVLGAVLGVYVALHVAELQTAFDTSISYPMLGLVLVLATALFEPLSEGWGSVSVRIPRALVTALAVVLGAAAVWSLWCGVVPLAQAEYANGAIRRVTSPERRFAYYPMLLGSPVDSQAFLWRAVTDYQRGIALNPRVLEDAALRAGLAKESVIFEQGYRAYVQQHPGNLRAKLNLADILIYQRLFGVDKLEEAQRVLDTAITMAPHNPQPYWMKAVGYIYMRKFDLAREYAKRGLAINSKIPESQQVVQYVEESIRTFPDIGLYFFRQI